MCVCGMRTCSQMREGSGGQQHDFFNFFLIPAGCRRFVSVVGFITLHTSYNLYSSCGGIAAASDWLRRGETAVEIPPYQGYQGQ